MRERGLLTAQFFVQGFWGSRLYLLLELSESLKRWRLLFLNHFSPLDCNLYIGKENNFVEGKKKTESERERGMEKKTQKKGNL